MNKKAFTLAETLVTLGVIGVVAALTLPTLIKEYQKHIWVNQLKKSVSVVENGFKLAMAYDEVMELENTKLLKNIDNKLSYDNGKETVDIFLEEFKNYFNIIKSEDFEISDSNYRMLNGNKIDDSSYYVGIYLVDGSMLFLDLNGTASKKSQQECKDIKTLGGTMCSQIGYIEIDVNGIKKPNQYGRDIFLFAIDNNGKLYPYRGKDTALFENLTIISNNNRYWKNSNECNSQSSNWGIGCAARIIENGWKMDY